MTGSSADVGKMVDAFSASIDMDDNADYLRRGRRLKAVPTDDLHTEWVLATKAWCLDQSAETQLAKNDAASELRLRGSPLPYGEVQHEMAELRTRLKDVDLDRTALKERASQFLKGYNQPSS